MSWHGDFVLIKVPVVAFLIIPAITVSFPVSVVRDLEILEACKEIGMTDEEDTAAGCGGQWVDAMRHLRPVGRSSTSGVRLRPGPVEKCLAPRIANHVHFVIGGAGGLELEGGDKRVSMTSRNTTRVH